MNKKDIAGLKIDSLNKKELLSLLLERAKNNRQTWITTVYSEFLYAGLKDPKIMQMLNKANVAITDGAGVIWADKFLSLPVTFKNQAMKTFQCLWQTFRSLVGMIFNRKWEKIVGADLVWDISKLASYNNFSIYLLGGFNDTPNLVSSKLKTAYSKLNVVGASNKNINDSSTINDINKAQPDILFVAYGPIKQEQWISKHLKELPSVKLIMGVGGSFDYIVGKRVSPPKWLRRIGFEWLWRLVTQPYRIKRIWNATFGLIAYLIRYKISAGKRK